MYGGNKAQITGLFTGLYHELCEETKITYISVNENLT